jgi:hypothetical protein
MIEYFGNLVGAALVSTSVAKAASTTQTSNYSAVRKIER